MSIYSKIELFGFADYYHRFATTGLTMDEMFLNWVKYSENPRDINDIVKLPRRLKEEIARVKPPAIKLWSILKMACRINGVEYTDVNSVNRKRELAQVRQQVCYVAMELGFIPADIPKILKWDRSQTYARVKKCRELATSTKKFREDLDELLDAFGLEPFTNE